MAREFTTTDPELTVAVQRMTEHDLLEVVEIEKTSGLSPWGWDAYHRELQLADDVMMLVARPLLFEGGERAGNSILGFIVARIIAADVHVNNVAVRPEFRRSGIAAKLLEAVLEWGRRRQAMRALLEVRGGNTAAQALYQRCGFRVVGRRQHYYRSPVEDALLMSVSLRCEP